MVVQQESSVELLDQDRGASSPVMVLISLRQSQ